jgi:hypothetical protein
METLHRLAGCGGSGLVQRYAAAGGNPGILVVWFQVLEPGIVDLERAYRLPYGVWQVATAVDTVVISSTWALY